MGRRINLIVNKITKGYEIRQDKPNENWIEGADVFIVEDETELSDKIIDNYPYFEFTLDVNGGLIDITPTERPPKTTRTTFRPRCNKRNTISGCISLSNGGINVIDWFVFVSSNYPNNYTIDQVKIFVVKLKITEAQFLEITGEVYTA